MKKLMMAALAAAALTATFAADSATGEKKKPRRLTPEIKAMLMARTGGTVVLRAEGPAFLYVNAQGKVATADLKKVPEELERVLNFPFEMRDEEVKGCPLEAAGGFLGPKAAAAILIVDDPKIPTTTLQALESRWAIVNVAALSADKPSDETLAARVRKEMWRTFAVLMGASDNQRYGCLMKNVASLEDLDKLPYETVSPDPFPAVCRTMTKYGMKRNKSATYRKAFIEGWAPPPTTEMQRKIVEEETARKKAAEAAAGAQPTAKK